MEKSKILDLIRKIEKEKQVNRIVPTHALLIPVLNECISMGITKNEAKTELDRLEKEGKIKRGPTIKDQYIKTA